MCSKLMTVDLRGISSVPYLNTSSVFMYTPMLYSSYTGAFGSIYVPTSLLTSFKTATNWSKYSARFVGV